MLENATLKVIRMKKIPYLVVLASSSQLYSGTGVAIFEWIRFAREEFDFAICIDNAVPLNYKIARDFCQAEGLRFLPSGPKPWPGGADPGNAMAPIYVGSGRWKLVEFVSWANTTVNLDILDARPAGVKLVYTPHTQPAWTMPNADKYWGLEPGFDRMLRECDLICCDSPAEIATVQRRVPDARASFIPIGIDAKRFQVGNQPREPFILVVADFNEVRKRTDLSLAAIHRLLARNSEYRAVLAGRNSDLVKVPGDIAERIERCGFISEAKLLSLYQECSAFLLLSDYEAFGIPIVEALCCGAPVVTTKTSEATSLFEGLPGCYLINNSDDRAVDFAIDKAITCDAREEISAAASARFSHEVASKLKLEAIQHLLTTTTDATD